MVKKTGLLGTKTMVNKTLKVIFKGFISIIFLTYLIFKVEWALFMDLLRTADLTFYIGSTLLALLGSFFLGVKYYVLIKGTSLARSLFSVVKINFISRYYGLFLPSAVGPELVRWYKMTQNRGGHAFFLASTLFERLTFVFLLLLSSFIPILLFTAHPGIVQLRVQILPVMFIILALTIVAFSYFIFPSFQFFLRAIIERVLRSKDKWQRIFYFLDNFSLKNTSYSLCGFILILGLFWHLFFLGRMFLLFQGLFLPLGFMDVVWMSSLVLLLQILPISLGGIGIREGAYAYLFSLYNLPPEQGVLIGALFFSQMVLFAVIGGWFEWLEGDSIPSGETGKTL